jgi:hypothetical protein
LGRPIPFDHPHPIDQSLPLPHVNACQGAGRKMLASRAAVADIRRIAAFDGMHRSRLSASP